MFVYEYLEQAAMSELSPLSIGDISLPKGLGPDDEQYGSQLKLINYVNRANLEVHKIFQLIQKRIQICNDPPECLYRLSPDFIYAIYASFLNGEEVPLNNDRNVIVNGVERCVSLMFPAPFLMQVKGIDGLGRVSIGMVYVAAPDKVCKMDDWIDLGAQYNEAMVNYISYLAYCSQNGDIKATNNTFYMRFRESCNAVRLLGLQTEDNLNDNCKLIERGFV
jgi:hypothetical protein